MIEKSLQPMAPKYGVKWAAGSFIIELSNEDVTHMIEAKVNFHGGNKEVYISQLNGGFDEIANDLVIILDRILVDELIKISPQNMKLSEEEKEKIILTARNQILEKMRYIAFKENEYIYSEETSLYLTQKYGI